MNRRKRLRMVCAALAIAMMGGATGRPQAQDREKQPAQQPPAKQQPSQPAPNSNPFPEDTTNVPVMPDGKTAPVPEAPAELHGPAPALPAADVDPVRSPDEPLPNTSSESSGSSSSSADLANILAPPSDEETRKTRNGKGTEPPEHKETAKEDENVGEYYLEQRNWRAALSRFQSALVLDPENPDVYWGLAEAQRHLGDMVNAKANYTKVTEYDPDSKHAKEARKLLKEPEMAGATAPAKQ